MNRPPADIIGSARIAQRRRSVRLEKRRVRRRVALGVVLIGAIAYGSVVLSQSSVFRLERIDVVGATSVPIAQVIAASGLRTGENALAADLGAAADGVRALPQIADARIERVGSLVLRIVVSERRPVIELRTADGPVYLDMTGRPVEAGTSPGRLPVLRAPAFATVPADTIAATLQTWRAVPDKMRSRIAELLLEADGSLRFTMDRVLVIVGSSARLPEKIDALLAVERQARANNRRLLEVDLRVPERPTARLA